MVKIVEMKEVGGNIKVLDVEINVIDEELCGIIIILLNLLDDFVFVGVGEEENVEVCCWSELRIFVFELKLYWEVVENLGILDFECGVKVVGSCFVYYKGLGVCLECVLYNFMLDLYVYEYGYIEMIMFYIVNDIVMFGIG